MASTGALRVEVVSPERVLFSGEATQVITRMTLDRLKAIATGELEKAEKEAIKGEYFGLLHLIYDHIIELSLQNHKIDAEKYVQKRKANDKKYQVSQQLNSVLAIINNQLFASNFSGKDESIIEQLENIIKEWEFTEIYQNSVKIQFQIHACVRDALLQKKDFEALENYLMESLLNFEQKKLS